MEQRDIIKEKKDNPPAQRFSQEQLKGNRHFSYWLKKNRYYHQEVIDFYRFYIPQGSSVLHINCKNGYVLNAVKPSVGVGVDEEGTFIQEAEEFYTSYQFDCGSVADLTIAHQFDYIILSMATMKADDIQKLFYQLHRFCHPGTRIIVESYSYLWTPVLWLTQKFGLRRPTQFKNWVSRADMQNFLYLAGFDKVTSGFYMIMPIYIPLVSQFINRFVARVPLIRRLCLHEWMIMRPLATVRNASQASVSVVIPCRNEKGNIEQAVQRCPQMGMETEIIFVEGNSTDGTLQEIQRVALQYPEKNIRWLVQDGKGKGDAVRKGFAQAHGDLLMILDGDLTVPPEELPKFFDALVSSKGECINGSRLVYGMESQAMMTIAYFANLFFGRLVSLVIGQRVKDTLCGTKVLWKKDYERIAAGRVGFGLYDPFGDFDLLFGAAKLGLKIIDMPVRYKRRMYGTSNICRTKDVWFLLWMCVRAWFKNR